MQAVDVLIVGAGVIGAAVAETLSRAGAFRIMLCERGTPGCEASNAAAGVLAVASGQARKGVLLELRRVSGAMFPAWVDRLCDETGIDVGYRASGVLSLACSDAEVAGLRELVEHRRSQGMRCEWLDAAAVRAVEPAVHPDIRGAALFPDDHSVDSARLVAALVAAAVRRGVALRDGTAVHALVPGPDSVRVAVGDDVIDAGIVVVAAGAWSCDLLLDLGVRIPVRPARGEMAALTPVGCAVRHTLMAGDGYVVPHGDEVLVGSTTAFVGFDKQVTAAGVAALRAHAAALVPAFAAVPFTRTWAGLRPCSTIRRPIIARLPGAPRVIVATGHHRNGVLLAPATARLVADLVTGAPPVVSLAPFVYRRH